MAQLSERLTDEELADLTAEYGYCKDSTPYHATLRALTELQERRQQDKLSGSHPSQLAAPQEVRDFFTGGRP